METNRLRSICGIALIVAGVVAVAVPVIPGVPMIVAGAAMLGHDHPWVRPVRAWFEKRGLWRRSDESR